MKKTLCTTPEIYKCLDENQDHVHVSFGDDNHDDDDCDEFLVRRL